MAKRKIDFPNKVELVEFLDKAKPFEFKPDVNIDDLVWEPDAPETAAEKKRAAEAYAEYLKQSRADRKKRSLPPVKPSPDARRHPSMYENPEKRGLDPKAIAKQKKSRIITQKKAEEWWVRESRSNVAAFMRYVWGYKPNEHHIKWFKQMLDPDSDKTIIIGPRGSAKSTVAMVFLSWAIGHNPHLAYMFISVTLKQAQDRLEALRDVIMNWDRYKKVFPHITVDAKRPNNKTTLNVKRTDMQYNVWRSFVARNSDPKSPTMYAAGVGGSGVIGSRCTGLLIMDDVMDERNIATEELRLKLQTWVSQTLMPTLTSKARVIHITTRWHTDDLVASQIKTGQWTYSYTRALIHLPDGSVGSYWPEEFPLKRLAAIHATVLTPVFKIMFLCIATALKGELFDIDDLRQEVPKDSEYRWVFVSCDPALKAKQQADDTAIVTVGITKSGEMHVLDILTGKWRPETTASRMSLAWSSAYEKYGVEPYLLIETIGGMELFLTLLNQIGVVPVSRIATDTPNVDKYTRALPLAAIAESGKLFFDFSLEFYNKAVSQLIEFTGEDGNADDIVDALSQVAKRIRGSAKQMIREATNKNYVIPGAT